MSKKGTVKIVNNAVHAKLIDPAKEVRLLVSDILGYVVGGAEHMNRGSWDGSASMFKMRTNSFPSGFVRLVTKKLETAGYKVITKSVDAPKPLGPENPKVDDFPENPMYAYQAEVARRLLALKGMIAQVATGGGKSRIFKICAARIGRQCLFVTTRKSLMYQMAEAFEKDMKTPVGILGDGEWSPRPGGANFAIVNTLSLRLKELCPKKEAETLLDGAIQKREEKIKQVLEAKGLPTDTSAFKTVPVALKTQIDKIRAAVISKVAIDLKAIEKAAAAKCERHNAKRRELIEFLKGVEFVCLEEAHEVSGDGYHDIMNACVNAVYRLALTATPFMKDDQEANMRLTAVTGPVGIKVTEKDLIDRGILAKPYFKYIQPPKADKVFKTTPWQRAYSEGVVSHQDRNDAIVAECLRAKQHGLTSMVLIQLTKHGKALEKLMKDQGIKVKFIYGKHEQSERKAALLALGSGEIDVLIGSTILDVGVDVPSVGLVVLAGGGKAEVAMRQRIGRGLRAKKSGPNVCFVVDFTDVGSKHLVGHSRERRRIVEQTPGFVEGIVDDFPYEEVGLKRVS